MTALERIETLARVLRQVADEANRQGNPHLGAMMTISAASYDEAARLIRAEAGTPEGEHNGGE